jgi:hypothetical protein
MAGLPLQHQDSGLDVGSGPPTSGMLNEAVTLASMIDQHHTFRRKGGTRCDI